MKGNSSSAGHVYIASRLSIGLKGRGKTERYIRELIS